MTTRPCRFKSIRVEQSHLEAIVMDRILEAWLAEAAMVPGLLPKAVRPTLTQRTWMWDGTSHVDPLKEANAQSVRLASFTTTLADEYARMGLDWETQIRQRAKELALLNELGLTPESTVIDEEEPDAEDQPPNRDNVAAA